MFDSLAEQASRIAEDAALRHCAKAAERIRTFVPRGVEVEADATGIRLSGRRLKARLALDPALRFLGAFLR